MVEFGKGGEGWKGWGGVRRLVNGSGGKMPDVEHSFKSMHIHVYSNRPCKTSVTVPQICCCWEN